MEVRLCPADGAGQRVLGRTLQITPRVNVHRHVDYFGNLVEHFSVPHRHDCLVLVAESEVETFAEPLPEALGEVTVSEARQIYRSDPLRLHDFLMESPAVRFCPAAHRQANRLFRPGRAVIEGALELMAWVFEGFRYRPGSTTIQTPVAEVLERREGVCQDFAQVMLAVLRSAEIPARYVCGYIETEREKQASEADDEPALTGASESHAWVEVHLPGGHWLPLDPTNNCVAGQRHVAVARGRDYLDTSPTRGVFKGAGHQTLRVSVNMRRLAGAGLASLP
jgi:transglutaminase-like putative cysteine protease